MALRRAPASERRGTATDLLVIGLGNPGEEYARSRHNVGAEVVSELARRHGGHLKKSRARAMTTELTFAGRRLALALPITYVNLSGEAASALTRRYGVTDPERIVIVHDELDLPPGVVRVKVGGGLAGHNGLRSITQHLKTQDYARVRLGVGKPPSKERGADHVLRRMPKRERELLDVAVQVAADAVEVDRRRRPGRRHERLQQPMTLESLPPLLRDEPALADVLGRRSAVLAVPEAARALTLAGLSHLSGRSPLLVAVPSGTAAERLADDLAQLLPPNDVELFPAWETLPFERVSPSVETMGRRLRVLWRLSSPGHRPRVIVAGIRALLQRLGPTESGVEPILVRPGQTLDPEVLLHGLVGVGLPPRGAGRAPRRGGAPGLDHRRLPGHGRRPDPHRPLGRRGGPPDRVLRPRSALHRAAGRGAHRPRPRAPGQRHRAHAGGRAGRCGAVGS